MNKENFSTSCIPPLTAFAPQQAAEYCTRLEKKKFPNSLLSRSKLRSIDSKWNKKDSKESQSYLKGYRLRLKASQAVTTPLYKKLPLTIDKDFQNLACIEATFEEFLYAGERIRGEFRWRAKQLKKGDDSTASILLADIYGMFSHLNWHCEEAWKAALDLPTKLQEKKRHKKK